VNKLETDSKQIQNCIC